MYTCFISHCCLVSRPKDFALTTKLQWYISPALYLEQKGGSLILIAGAQRVNFELILVVCQKRSQ